MMKTETTMNLTNQFLIAMPTMDDARFVGSIIYVCEHSETGSLGLIINKPMEITLEQLLSKLELTDNEEHPHPSGQKVYVGGPVHPERGFVLHEPGLEYNSTVKVSDDFALTTSRDILQAVANGTGPEHFFVSLGYTGWDVGQLEQEVADNAWLTVEAAPSVVFHTPYGQRFNAALGLLGIDPVMLTTSVGHA